MTQQDIIKKIPSPRSKNETEEILGKYSDWFYQYFFQNGAVTAVNNDHILDIHKSRAGMIFPCLDDLYSGRWNSVSCCDIGCNQGWFAMQVALRGAKKVYGIDARPDHIRMANTIKDLSGLSNIAFEEGDLFQIAPKKMGTYTLTFFLGILYHLDNPMGALRIIRSITEHVCVLETQVVPRGPDLECTWGRDTYRRSGPGIAILESDEKHVCGGNALTFVPSINALHMMLFAAGFSRIYQCIPPPTVNEQYRTNDRIILFAYV